MAAPKVQTLAQARVDLDPAYAASKDVVNKQIAGLGAKYDAQRAGITAEKGQGFNAINNQATGRGASFSGIPIDEQATYLSTKFLPGMMAANAQQNEDDLALQGTLAGIDKEQRIAAQGRVDQQQSALNSWNMQEASLAAQARENALNREATARENAADRSFQASQSAATRAASQVNVYDTVESMLQNSMGSDRKVSPAAWEQAAAYASRNGLKFQGGDGFANRFWQYANGSHWQDYLGKRYNDKY